MKYSRGGHARAKLRMLEGKIDNITNNSGEHKQKQQAGEKVEPVEEHTALW